MPIDELLSKPLEFLDALKEYIVEKPSHFIAKYYISARMLFPQERYYILRKQYTQAKNNQEDLRPFHEQFSELRPKLGKAYRSKVSTILQDIQNYIRKHPSSQEQVSPPQ